MPKKSPTRVSPRFASSRASAMACFLPSESMDQENLSSAFTRLMIRRVPPWSVGIQLDWATILPLILSPPSPACGRGSPCSRCRQGWTRPPGSGRTCLQRTGESLVLSSLEVEVVNAGVGDRATVLCCGSRGTLPDGLHGVLWGRNDRAGLLLQDGGPKAVLEHRNRRVQGFQANGLTRLIERAVQAADPTGSILKLIELEVKGDCILGLNRDIRVLVLESGQPVVDLEGHLLLPILVVQDGANGVQAGVLQDLTHELTDFIRREILAHIPKGHGYVHDAVHASETVHHVCIMCPLARPPEGLENLRAVDVGVLMVVQDYPPLERESFIF